MTDNLERKVGKYGDLVAELRKTHPDFDDTFLAPILEREGYYTLVASETRRWYQREGAHDIEVPLLSVADALRARLYPAAPVQSPEGDFDLLVEEAEPATILSPSPATDPSLMLGGAAAAPENKVGYDSTIAPERVEPTTAAEPVPAEAPSLVVGGAAANLENSVGHASTLPSLSTLSPEEIQQSHIEYEWKMLGTADVWQRVARPEDIPQGAEFREIDITQANPVAVPVPAEVPPSLDALVTAQSGLTEFGRDDTIAPPAEEPIAAPATPVGPSRGRGKRDYGIKTTHMPKHVEKSGVTSRITYDFKLIGIALAGFGAVATLAMGGYSLGRYHQRTSDEKKYLSQRVDMDNDGKGDLTLAELRALYFQEMSNIHVNRSVLQQQLDSARSEAADLEYELAQSQDDLAQTRDVRGISVEPVDWTGDGIADGASNDFKAVYRNLKTTIDQQRAEAETAGNVTLDLRTRLADAERKAAASSGRPAVVREVVRYVNTGNSLYFRIKDHIADPSALQDITAEYIRGIGGTVIIKRPGDLFDLMSSASSHDTSYGSVKSQFTAWVEQQYHTERYPAGASIEIKLNR